ncbi:MAG: hypothetical protein IKB98_05065 [Clostridia bacterium]|nr:hypothetical protein [Clostridia bacterium]
MENNSRNKTSRIALWTTKECAFIAMFVALLTAVQLALSFVPGVELVTVLFVSYAFSMGKARGMLLATAFSLLRQIVFGINVTVLLLYLVYFNLLTFIFGFLGNRIKKPIKWLPVIIIVACLCTVLFSLIDCVITPLWYSYPKAAARAYFFACIPFMVPQVICTSISVFALFIPITRACEVMKKSLQA